MTNVLPDREVLTQPIAHRRYTTTTYDINTTAFLRPGEAPIILGSPTDAWITTGEIRTGDPAHAAEWSRLDDLFEEPQASSLPTPEPAPYPSKLFADGGERCGCCGHERKPFGRQGRRRRPVPSWPAYVIGAGLGSIGWSVLALAVLAVVR